MKRTSILKPHTDGPVWPLPALSSPVAGWAHHAPGCASRGATGRRRGGAAGLSRVGLLVIGLLLAGVGVCAAVFVLKTHPSQSPSKQGRLLLDVKRYGEAISFFEAALRADPTDAFSMRGLARCYMGMGKTEDATAWAEEATRYDKTPDAWVLLGELHLDLGKSPHAPPFERTPLGPDRHPRLREAGEWVRESFRLMVDRVNRLGHIRRALACGRRALKVDPECGPAWRLLANATSGLGDLPAALDHIRRAIEIEPGSRATRFAAADLFRQAGDLGAALEQSRYLVQTLEAKDPRYLGLAAEICVDLQLYDEAIPLIEERIRRGEDEASQRIAMAYCYLMKAHAEEAAGDTARMKSDYEQAVIQADKAQLRVGRAVPVDLYGIRGRALSKLGRYDRAIVDFRQLATFDKEKKDASSRYLLGKAYLALGERELARDAFLEATRIQPARLDAHEELAKLLAAEGELDKAAAELRKVVDAAPDQPAPYQRLVDFCLEHGLRETAERDLIRFLRLWPATPSMLALLARLQLERGEAEIALPRAYEALRLQPANPHFLLLVARALGQLGNDQKAAACFAEVVRRDPALLDAYLDWAALHERLGQQAEAQQVYDQARKALPDAVALRCAYARFCQATARPGEGIGELRAVLKRNPRELSAQTALVEHLLARGESDAALAQARQGAQLLPESVPAQALLARVHRARGEWKEFVAILDHVAANLDKNAFVTYQRLAAHVHELRLDAALEVGKEALKRFPTQRRTIQLDLAVVSFLSGCRREGPEPARSLVAGLEAARHIVGIDPNDCDAGFVVSLMMLIKKEPLQQIPACSQDALPGIALEAWRDLLNLNGRSPGEAAVVARVLLETLVYDNAGWHDLAAERCENILKGQPDNLIEPGPVPVVRLKDQPDCLIVLSLRPVLWERAGRRDKAIAACERLLAKSPGFARAKTLLGDLLLLDGKAERAKALYAEVARGDDPDPDVVTKGALFATLRGESAAAAKAWRGLLVRKSDLDLAYNAYNNLAWALATQPQPNLDEALTLITSALSRAPEVPAILDTAGWIHYLMGHEDDAVRHLEDAARRAPYRGLYHFHLGMAYARRQQDAEADESLRRAIELDPDGPFVEQARQALTNLRP